MRKPNSKSLLAVATLALAISLLSTTPEPEVALALTPATEAQVVGGSKCSTAWGLGLALGAASLSPCSVVCAVLAWYDLALIGAYCS
jgi:hypothetical protein